MSTITIIKSGCAPMIGAYYNLFTTFTGTEIQLQTKFGNEPDLVAIPSNGIFGKPDMCEYGIFKRRDTPVAMYQVTFGETAQSFLTMGDVLYYLNDTTIPSGMEVSITRPETQFGRQNEYQYITNSFSRKGVTQSLLTPDDFILQMFYEVFLNYVKPAGCILLPHELTRSKWEAILAVNSADDVYPIVTSTQRHLRDQLFNNKSEQKPRFYILRDYYTHLLRTHCSVNGADTQKVYSLYMDGLMHSDFIERALNDDLHIDETVLSDYQDPESLNKGFHYLIKYPQLRGKFSLQTTKILFNLMKDESITLDEITVNKLVELLASYPVKNPTYQQIDNFLYAKGFLNPFPKVDTPAFDRSSIKDHLTLAIHEQVIEHIKTSQIATLNNKASRGEISQRRFDQSVYAVFDRVKSTKPTWALKVGDAIRSKNIAEVLELLDSPDLENTVTKKAISEVTGIKLIGLNAADRRTNLFKLCGLDAADRTESENVLKQAREQSEFDQMKERLLETMKSYRIETKEYGALSVFEFLNTIISDGYNTLTSKKKGAASQYLLHNSQTGKAWPIKNKDGSLPYVRDVLQLPLMS